MHCLKTQSTGSIRILVSVLLALMLLGCLTAAGALASGAGRNGSGPGRIVFIGGKTEHCYMEACKNFDLVRSISPHGGGGRVLAKVRSAVETASTEDGTVAVLSKNVAGGGANANAFTQVYLITPNGKRTAVFRHRLQGFNATGLGISGDGKLLALSGRYTGGPSESAKIWIVRSVNPVFSPDGRSIAFGQDTGTSQNTVDVVRVNGSGLRKVTSTGGTYPDPDYSPNGRNLVFVGEIPHARGYDTAIYTVRTSGAARKLASSRFEDAGLQP